MLNIEPPSLGAIISDNIYAATTWSESKNPKIKHIYYGIITAMMMMKKEEEESFNPLRTLVTCLVVMKCGYRKVRRPSRTSTIWREAIRNSFGNRLRPPQTSCFLDKFPMFRSEPGHKESKNTHPSYYSIRSKCTSMRHFESSSHVQRQLFYSLSKSDGSISWMNSFNDLFPLKALSESSV